MTKSDAEVVNTSAREDEIHQLDGILAQDYVNIPLYAFPAMGVVEHGPDRRPDRCLHQQPGEHFLEHVRLVEAVGQN